MTQKLTLPPELTRKDFDTDLEFQEYLDTEAAKFPETQSDDWPERKAAIEQAAQITLKDLAGDRERITISVPRQNLNRIKAKALRQGVPYQSYINQVLHLEARSV